MKNLFDFDLGENEEKLSQQIVEQINNNMLSFENDNQVFSSLSTLLNQNVTNVSLKRKIVFRAIDNIWLDTIESALPSLDKSIRKPSKYIKETEDVLPIEQSKNITARSIRDLAVHSNYIKDIDEDGNILPSKILNVFRDETFETYENKFINTLIDRLYLFINKRYKDVNNVQQDEKSTVINFSSQIKSGDLIGKATINIEFSELPSSEDKIDGVNLDTNSSLRVKKLYNVVTAYKTSEFCKNLGNNYVRPPIMRTNALLKNPDLRQCLALWEFIESYNDVGYTSLSQEFEQEPSEEFIKKMVDTIAMQCVVFRNMCLEETPNDISTTDNLIKPKYVTDVIDVNSNEFDIRDSIYRNVVDVNQNNYRDVEISEADTQVINAMQTAIFYGLELEEAKFKKLSTKKEFAIERLYDRSFMSKLIQSEKRVQEYYSVIKNYLMSFKKVKNRLSWSYDSYNFGRNQLAKINVKGKTLCVFLALDPLAYDYGRYHQIDVSLTKRYSAVPMEIKVRSDRSLKRVKELIDILMASFGLNQEETKYIKYKYKYETTNELIRRGLIKYLGEDKEQFMLSLMGESEVEEDSIYSKLRYKRSFTSKIIQSSDNIKGYYSQIKNALLNYKKVKSRISWACETFNFGRNKLAKLKVKGKTLCLYLALNPDNYDENKYHHKNLDIENLGVSLPLLLKVKSDRAVKYALELIGELQAIFNLTALNNEFVDYHFDYKTDKELLKLGLIKEINKLNEEQEDSLEVESEEQTTINSSLENNDVNEDNNENNDFDNGLDDDDEELEEVAVSNEAQEDGYYSVMKYRRSFISRVYQASDELKEYYSEIKNSLLKYKKVKSRISWAYENFNFGRNKLARLKIKGKTIYLYLALNPKDYEESKYHHKDLDVDNVGIDYPLLLKVKSNRSLKYAKELIANFEEKFNLVLTNNELEEYKFDYKTDKELLEMGLIKEIISTSQSEVIKAQGEETAKDACVTEESVTIDNAVEENTAIDNAEEIFDEAIEEDNEISSNEELLSDDLSNEELSSEEENYYSILKYRRSFTAKLYQASDELKGYYTEIKNSLLKYKKVKSRISWGYENFNFGRNKLVKIKLNGKTLYLYFALNPKDYEESKYHHKDLDVDNVGIDYPLLLKVKSHRSLKYAKELIANFEEKFNLTLLDKELEDFNLDYKTDEELLELGLIKPANNGVKNTSSDSSFNMQDAINGNYAIEFSTLQEMKNSMLEKRFREREATIISERQNIAVPNVSESEKIEETVSNELIESDNKKEIVETIASETVENSSSSQEKASEQEEKVSEKIEEKVEEIATEQVEEKASETSINESEDLSSNEEIIKQEEEKKPIEVQDTPISEEQFDFNLDSSYSAEIFKKFTKEEVIAVIKKIRKNTATSMSDNVAGEILACYKTMLKLNFFARHKYRRIFKGNNIDEIMTAKDKLLKIYMDKIIKE